MSSAVGQHRAARARGDVLEMVVAVRGDVAEGSQEPSLPAREVGLGAVLDHGDAVTLAQRDERLDVGGEARVVDHDDGAGLPVDELLHAPRVHVVRRRIDVREPGHQHLVEHAGERAHVGDRGGDHLPARLDAERAQRDVHRRGARGAAAGVLHAVHGLHHRLHLLHLGAEDVEQHVAVEHLQDLLLLLLAEPPSRSERGGLGLAVRRAGRASPGQGSMEVLLQVMGERLALQEAAGCGRTAAPRSGSFSRSTAKKPSKPRRARSAKSSSQSTFPLPGARCRLSRESLSATCTYFRCASQLLDGERHHLLLGVLVGDVEDEPEVLVPHRVPEAEHPVRVASPFPRPAAPRAGEGRSPARSPCSRDGLHETVPERLPGEAARGCGPEALAVDEILGGRHARSAPRRAGSSCRSRGWRSRKTPPPRRPAGMHPWPSPHRGIHADHVGKQDGEAGDRHARVAIGGPDFLLLGDHLGEVLVADSFQLAVLRTPWRASRSPPCGCPPILGGKP